MSAIKVSCLGSEGVFSVGKKINKTSDQSETCLLRKAEGGADSRSSRLQPEIMPANEMPPINTAININRGSNIAPH